jgi:hypothetical protein
LECFVIDMSASGAAVSSDEIPNIGTPLAVGKVVGQVIRHFEDGFAIRFNETQTLDRLEKLILYNWSVEATGEILNPPICDLKIGSLRLHINQMIVVLIRRNLWLRGVGEFVPFMVIDGTAEVGRTLNKRPSLGIVFLSLLGEPQPRASHVFADPFHRLVANVVRLVPQ